MSAAHLFLFRSLVSTKNQLLASAQYLLLCSPSLWPSRPVFFGGERIADRQLAEMRKSTDAATGAANVAQASLQQIRENAYLDQRPWVTVSKAILAEPLAVGQQPKIHMQVINTVKTPRI